MWGLICAYISIYSIQEIAFRKSACGQTARLDKPASGSSGQTVFHTKASSRSDTGMYRIQNVSREFNNQAQPLSIEPKMGSLRITGLVSILKKI